MASRRRGRVIAFQALYAWELAHPAREDLVRFDWLSGDAPEADLSFPRLLVLGTLERLEEVDGAIKGSLQHWDISRLSKVDLAILRLATYSILYRTEIPARVTIDEAVEMAKDFGSDESYRFVNGVLDSIRRGPGGNRL